MAHVINLVTQAFMGTLSTSKHYDPATPEAELVSASDEDDRDVIGIIRAITVKVSETDHTKIIYSISWSRRAGAIIGETKRNVQKHSNSQPPIATLARHEGAVVVDVHHASSCTGPEGGK